MEKYIEIENWIEDCPSLDGNKLRFFFSYLNEKEKTTRVVEVLTAEPEEDLVGYQRKCKTAIRELLNEGDLKNQIRNLAEIMRTRVGQIEEISMVNGPEICMLKSLDELSPNEPEICDPVDGSFIIKCFTAKLHGKSSL